MKKKADIGVIKSQAIQSGKTSFEALFMNLPDPCFVVSPKLGVITHYNPAFKTILKATDADLVGRSQFDISPD